MAHVQGEELEPARAKAEKMGIKQIFIDDLREEFVRDFVFPMFRCVICSYSRSRSQGLQGCRSKDVQGCRSPILGQLQG